MKILRTYILKEHLGPFLVTLSGLTAVMLIGNIIKLADLVITKGVSLFDIVRLLIYLVPFLLSFTIPIAALIAIVMAFGRLSSDYELIAMRASGVAPVRLVFPVLMASAVLSAGVLVLNDRIIPAAHLAFRQQLKAIGVKRPTAYLEAGTFIREFTPYIMFIYHIEGKTLYNVRIYEPQPNGPTRTILATRGEFEPLPKEQGVRLKLYEGTADEWDLTNPGSFYKAAFTTYSMTLTTDAKGDRLDKKFGEMTFGELLNERQVMQAQGIDPLPLILEFHRKIASSFATVIFVLFGLAMGLRLHHHERLMVFVWVLGLTIAYYLAAIGMDAIAVKGRIPAWLAMWLPNLVGGTFGVAQLYRALRH